MKSICIIGQFPPPIHGLSKALETLCNSKINNIFELHKINITNNKNIITNLFRIIFSNTDLFYFTISQTKGGNWRDLLILKAIALKGKKCIIHLHGGYFRNLIDNDCPTFQKKLNYSAINKINACIVLGDSLKYIFKNIVDENKIYTVPNCVDNIYLLSQDDYKKKLTEIKSNNTINILYLSNFIESKGYKEVLNLALIAKRQKKNNLHFHFAGKFFKKEDKIFMEDFISHNHLEDIVTYHGIVYGEKKISLLKACHIFILLTRYPNEGQPISILEAMGNCMAIISTNHAGIPDIIKNNINGLIVDKDNIDLSTIYDYISHIYSNRDLLNKIAQVNYNVIQSQYTEEKYIDNMINVFNTVINE